MMAHVMAKTAKLRRTDANLLILLVETAQLVFELMLLVGEAHLRKEHRIKHGIRHDKGHQQQKHHRIKAQEQTHRA